MSHNTLERLRQYIGKASFSASSDEYSALECLKELQAERDALAARVQKMQVSFLKILELENTETDEWDGVERVIPEMCAISRSALATPGNYAAILARRDAATIRMVAARFNGSLAYNFFSFFDNNASISCELEGMALEIERDSTKADELLKGLEK